MFEAIHAENARREAVLLDRPAVALYVYLAVLAAGGCSRRVGGRFDSAARRGGRLTAGT